MILHLQYEIMLYTTFSVNFIMFCEFGFEVVVVPSELTDYAQINAPLFTFDEFATPTVLTYPDSVYIPPGFTSVLLKS